VPRPPRPPTEGCLVHVFDHAAGSDPLFRDAPDRRIFLALLGETATTHGLDLLAWCLMGNHTHLLVRDRRGNLPAALRELKARYAATHNRRHGRFGPLFSGRYGARHVLDESHLLHAVRYVLLNPVAAGLVDHPSGWQWSSYGVSMGLEPAPAWSAAAEVTGMFARGEEEGRARLRAFVEEGIGRRPFDFRAAEKQGRRESTARVAKATAAERRAPSGSGRRGSWSDAGGCRQEGRGESRR
jgi:REP element-mobilizing transposase RayT